MVALQDAKSWHTLEDEKVPKPTISDAATSPADQGAGSRHILPIFAGLLKRSPRLARRAVQGEPRPLTAASAA